MTPPTPEPVITYTVSSPQPSGSIGTIYEYLHKYVDGVLTETIGPWQTGAGAPSLLTLREDKTVTLARYDTSNLYSAVWYYDTQPTPSWFGVSNNGQTVVQLADGWDSQNAAVLAIKNAWSNSWGDIDDFRYGRIKAEVEQ